MVSIESNYGYDVKFIPPISPNQHITSPNNDTIPFFITVNNHNTSSHILHRPNDLITSHTIKPSVIYNILSTVLYNAIMFFVFNHSHKLLSKSHIIQLCNNQRYLGYY